MISAKALRPGSQLGVYPQQLDRSISRFDRAMDAIAGRVRDRMRRRRFSLAFVRDRVSAAAEDFDGLDLPELQAGLPDLRYRLHSDGLKDELVWRSFALVQAVSARVLGKAHYPTQLLGGWVILNGNMAEMDTGEGKSLTATLPAITAALAGVPVHVVTSNEYLAERDAEEMAPLYQAMGLSVSVALESMGGPERRQAYASDIVYVTNQQLVFDYLRDRLAGPDSTGRLAMKFSEAGTGGLSLRGLCFAILDEADSVLIDEARTPLVLSRDIQDATRERIYAQALELADSLSVGDDFELNGPDVTLTKTGRESVDRLAEPLQGLFRGRKHREFLVKQALVARHVLRKDHHYLVRNSKVEIIDQNTGRIMADRSWQMGLHQMVECKEGCPVTGQRETLASISYQRFFRRYLHLGGMSGTLRQVRRELRATYGLGTVRVPNYRPGQRRHRGYVIHTKAQEKWLAVLNAVVSVHRTGQPILVGACSLYDSDLLGRLFTRRKLRHRILNARQDQSEAEVVAHAGVMGRITVATNMAGRGTDIKLGDGVEETGGLHVVAAECNPEFRVDRQLFGRSARQGDPGSCEAILSLEDKLFTEYYPRWLLRRLEQRKKPIAGWLARAMVRLPQWANAARSRQQRDDLLQVDEKLGKTLAYSGRGD